MTDITQLFLHSNATLQEALQIQENATRRGLPKGMVIVVNNQNQLIATVTDGDIRRALLSGRSLSSNIVDVMQMNPIYFPDTWSARDILKALPAELHQRKRNSKNFLGKIIITDSNRLPVKVVDYHQLWEHRMAYHRHIVLLGLGYVGLTLALTLADAGFKTTGVDVDEKKINNLKKGYSYIHEVGLTELLRENIHKTFYVSDEIPEDADVFIIAVGTPVEVSVNNDQIPRPDMQHLARALEIIATKLKPGNLVILRSTVPVSTCRNYVIPKLEDLSGLKCGFDFHLSFAPERTAEGKAIKELRTLPQVIGGYNEDATDATAAIFKELTPMIVRVSSLEAAEMVKLINNSFRDYVFAYSNFITQLARPFNLDVHDVIRAANQGYPRNEVPLPSPGVGGPCLTKDPYIFSSVVEQQGLKDPVFKESRAINEGMHLYIVEQLEEQLVKINKSILDARILICGLAFKGYPETGDIRNSTSVEILKLLEEKGAEVYGYDPVALPQDIQSFNIKSVSIPKGFEGMDTIMFLNNHRSFEKLDVFQMVRVMNDYPIIYDGWNTFHEDDILNTRPSIYMGLSHVSSSLQNNMQA